MIRFAPAVLAVLVLACGSEVAVPTGTPTAAMAVYCLEEPFAPYAGGDAAPVTWARQRGELYLDFRLARQAEIPANQPVCGLEYWLVRFAGPIDPMLFNSYAAYPDGGFMMGLSPDGALDERFALLELCASGAGTASECADLSVVIQFGPSTTSEMTLDPDEDELSEWLARTPPPDPTPSGSEP